jgi:2'-5' RNA ligase
VTLEHGLDMSEAIVSERLRLFVAVSIPEEIKREMGRAQAELRQALPADAMRWTRPEQFHLTLKFLGKVEANQIETLAARLEAACLGFVPIRLRAEQIGFFPARGRPRVVWVAVRDEQGELTRLHQDIEKASRAFTDEEPEGNFTGHATIGRARNIRREDLELLARFAGKMRERVFGEWIADGVELMRSELSAEGARHTAVRNIPFGNLP